MNELKLAFTMDGKIIHELFPGLEQWEEHVAMQEDVALSAFIINWLPYELRGKTPQEESDLFYHRNSITILTCGTKDFHKPQGEVSELVQFSTCLRSHDGKVLLQGFVDFVENDNGIIVFLFPDFTLHAYQGSRLLEGLEPDCIYQLKERDYDIWKLMHIQTEPTHPIRFNAHAGGSDIECYFGGSFDDNCHETEYAKIIFELNPETKLLEFKKMETLNDQIFLLNKEIRSLQNKLNRAKKSLKFLKGVGK